MSSPNGNHEVHTSEAARGSTLENRQEQSDIHHTSDVHLNADDVDIPGATFDGFPVMALSASMRFGAYYYI